MKINLEKKKKNTKNSSPISFRKLTTEEDENQLNNTTLSVYNQLLYCNDSSIPINISLNIFKIKLIWFKI